MLLTRQRSRRRQGERHHRGIYGDLQLGRHATSPADRLFVQIVLQGVLGQAALFRRLRVRSSQRYHSHQAPALLTSPAQRHNASFGAAGTASCSSSICVQNGG
jgi:hypothetical protein